MKRAVKSFTKVAVVGGGTGLAQALKALRRIRDLEITAICTSADDGGCTGVLRKYYGQSGYVGDLMKCLLALSSTPADPFLLSMEYRFPSGPYDGMVGRNLVFVNLLRTMQQIELPPHRFQRQRDEVERQPLFRTLNVLFRKFKLGRHRVFPVTEDIVELDILRKDGVVIKGESNVNTFCRATSSPDNYSQIAEIKVSPPSAKAYLPSLSAVRAADIVVIATGSFFTSIMPVLCLEEMRETIRTCRGKRLLMFPLLIHPEEIGGYHAEDLLERIETQIGRECDLMLCNNDFYGESDRIPEWPNQAQKKKTVSFHTMELPRDPRMIFARLRTGPDSGLHDPALTAKAFIRAFAVLNADQHQHDSQKEMTG